MESFFQRSHQAWLMIISFIFLVLPHQWSEDNQFSALKYDCIEFGSVHWTDLIDHVVVLTCSFCAPIVIFVLLEFHLLVLIWKGVIQLKVLNDGFEFLFILSLNTLLHPLKYCNKRPPKLLLCFAARHQLDIYFTV